MCRLTVLFLITFLTSACTVDYSTCQGGLPLKSEISELLKSGKTEEIVEKLLPFAESGNRVAQHNVGLFLWETKPKKAFQWNMKSAEQGCIEGVLGIATAYQKGYGVEKDPKKAFEWFLRAAESGDRFAAMTVGRMYENGEGVEKNNDKFYYWFEKSNEPP